MAMKFVKVYYDWLSMMEPLSDGERGRLITAVLKYASGDQIPELVGGEKYTFYALKSQIDRDKQSYAELSARRKEIGALGGLAKATKRYQELPNASKRYQTLANATKTCQDKDKDKEEDIRPTKEKTPTESKRKFSPPSLEEVREYCRQRKNTVKPEAFVDFYTSKGWMVGKTPMKDWKAAVRNWEHHEKPAAEPEKEDPYANVII